MPDGGDRRLLQAHTDLAAPAADVPLPQVRAAVVVAGGQPDQRRDGLTAVLPQLRQVGQQGAGDLRPDARDRLQDLVAPGRRRSADPVPASFQVPDLAFAVVAVLRDALQDWGQA
ncbi:MAG TPA: hypothetical protein VEL76_30675 [Gemmataceae bacterium]|nr:hypothetical protein [Gemmataceae bacterium]